ncbi:hypothetical protein MBLNU230_g6687t1 [Neophaeotheca triangularis]
MNGAGTQKRRSARLSAEGVEDVNEGQPPQKKTKVAGQTTVGTKTADGGPAVQGRKGKGKKVYDQVDDDDGFMFSKGSKKGKSAKANATTTAKSTTEAQAGAGATGKTGHDASAETAAPKTAKKTRRQMPSTPERDAADRTVRRSKRISNEHEQPQPEPQASPIRASHAKSHLNTKERSPSPEKARPVTVEKKRRRVVEAEGEGAERAVEEQRTARIALPFADTPVIKRNKEMRKASADMAAKSASAGGSRRTSSGMRGKRASSLMEEGKGSALPHPEVPTSEFYKHISADLTEPRRMRCLLGWCSNRALPPKPSAPTSRGPEAQMEFQALQAARVIQAELAQDLVSRGILSDWFSRDETADVKTTVKKAPNPRNVTNASKAEELEAELERLKQERAQWDALLSSTNLPTSPRKPSPESADPSTPALSPINPDLLSTPDRAIFAQLNNAPITETETDTPSQPLPTVTTVQSRLQTLTANLEFNVDALFHGVHALAALGETGDRLADRVLRESASVLEARESRKRELVAEAESKENGAGEGVRSSGVAVLDALRGLGRVLNEGAGDGGQQGLVGKGRDGR